MPVSAVLKEGGTLAHSRDVKRIARVDDAVAQLARLISEGSGGDRGYFESQTHRFRHTAARIDSLCEGPARILDVGSHYLHQAGLLRLLGHDVFGVDVPVFSRADLVVERARRLGIINLTVESLESGELLPDADVDGTFDVVVFTAILEHITFNPVKFWRRVYELLSNNGRIYVTTPNGLRPVAFLRSLRRLLTRTGIGITVNEVIHTVTYGHHWKEYSAAEIEEYFRILSPDFQVVTEWYDDSRPQAGVKGFLKRFVSAIPSCRPEIEAIVSLKGKSGRFAEPPALPIAPGVPQR